MLSGKTRRNLLSCLLVAVCAVNIGSVSTHAAATKTPGPLVTDNPLPNLTWQIRSDWIDITKPNPKFPDAPVAIGDGKADDTLAIQTAIFNIKRGETLYFPAGTYRITKTITTLSPNAKLGDPHLGINLIGHGRKTVLFWDGAEGGIMFQQNIGWPISAYIGLTWDGRGKAAIGQDITTKKRFETEMLYQHCAYLNFTTAGFKSWYHRTYASAETVFENCYFANCSTGIYLAQFNVLDYVIKGCKFQGCGIGINSAKGTNFYARECNFVGSTKSDVVFNGEHGASVRRCTSQGSNRFVIFGSYVSPLTIQDCRVDGWKNKDGAVVTQAPYSAPLTMFDNVFTNPPSKDAPVVCGNKDQPLILSNNKAPGCDRVVADNSLGIRKTIPTGTRGGALKNADQQFFRSSVHMPGKIFDAKRDFGAKGDMKTDDTAAIQKTIDAARKHGKRALAYFPQGRYKVTAPIIITGKDYIVSGCGFGSALIWQGAETGHTVEVFDTNKVTLTNMVIGRHDYPQKMSHADILQKPSKQPSTICYDRVWTYGMYMKKPNVRGYRAENLNKHDKVYFKEFNGNIRLTDSADATVFLGTTWEGTITIEGKDTDRSGFIGGGVRLSTISNPGLQIKDNHSLVYSDFYNEQCLMILRAEGDNKLPAGRIVLSGPKYENSYKSKLKSMVVNNYRGDIIIGPNLFYPGRPIHHMEHNGTAPLDITLWANIMYQCKPGPTFGPNGKLHTLGNIHLTMKYINKKDVSIVSHTTPGIADTPGDSATKRVAQALDDFRRLGEVELEFSFGDQFE
jgi:hypothetical protein